MNKTIIYLRVSSDKQTEESQLKPCEALCKERNYDIVSVYKNVKMVSFNWNGKFHYKN